MKTSILSIAFLVTANLSCSLTDAKLFADGESSSGLRGGRRNNGAGSKRNKQLAQKKKLQDKKKQKEGGDGKKKNKPGNNRPNKKDKPKWSQQRPDKKKPGKKNNNKPGSKNNNKPSKNEQQTAFVGRDYEARIIGGTEAQRNKYPYAVSIQDYIGHFCGGSLITRNAILTAAHCQGGTYDIVLGRHDLSTNAGQTIGMQREVPHPNYDKYTTNNDFMVVFLDDPATLTSDVSLVTLNDNGNVPSVGGGVTVMGWGDTDIRDEVSNLSDVLMKVNVNVMDNDDCDDSAGTIGGYSDNYHGQITSSMLCARANRQDSCQGDSGGPLVETKGGTDVQVGVVSWGIGCASEDFPGVYARVSSAYNWIEDTVCSGNNRQYAEEAGFNCSGSGGGGGGGGISAAAVSPPSPSPPSSPSKPNPSPSKPNPSPSKPNPAPTPSGGGNYYGWDDDDFGGYYGFSGGSSGGSTGGGGSNKPPKPTPSKPNNKPPKPTPSKPNNKPPKPTPSKPNPSPSKPNPAPTPSYGGSQASYYGWDDDCSWC